MVCNQIYGIWPNIWYMAIYMVQKLPYIWIWPYHKKIRYDRPLHCPSVSRSLALFLRISSKKCLAYLWPIVTSLQIIGRQVLCVSASASSADYKWPLQHSTNRCDGGRILVLIVIWAHCNIAIKTPTKDMMLLRPVLSHFLSFFAPMAVFDTNKQGTLELKPIWTTNDFRCGSTKEWSFPQTDYARWTPWT